MVFSFGLLLLLFQTIAPIEFVVALDITRLLYKFPNGTAVENSATRHDGTVLTTISSEPEIYLFDPRAQNPQPSLVHQFSDPKETSLLGITETSSDTFQIVVSNGITAASSGAPIVNRIYSLTFPHNATCESTANSTATPNIQLTATLPDAKLLNGLATLNKNTILAADSRRGAIYSVNIVTGKARIVVSDPLMIGNGSTGFGVNGINVYGDYLYYTSSDQGLLAKVHIDLESGVAKGPSTIIAKLTGGLYDDFNIDSHGNAYVAAYYGNEVQKINLSDGSQETVAGGGNSTYLIHPTSVSFGKGPQEEKWAYVTTASGNFVSVQIGRH